MVRPSETNREIITYVLWAKTTKDESELISTTYTFPKVLKFGKFDRMEWDYSKTKQVKKVDALYLQLNGSPSFFRATNSNTITATTLRPYIRINSSEEFSLLLPIKGRVTVKLIDNKGTTVKRLLINKDLAAGTYKFPLSNKQSGVYFIQTAVNEQITVQKVVLP